MFGLQATRVRRRGILLIPAFDRAGNSFWVCGGTDTLLHVAYHGVAPRKPSSGRTPGLAHLPRVAMGGPHPGDLHRPAR
jgi:hypothetical protein